MPLETNGRIIAGPGSAASRDAVMRRRMRCVPARARAVRSPAPNPGGSQTSPDPAVPQGLALAGRRACTVWGQHWPRCRIYRPPADQRRRVLQRVDCALTGLAFVDAEGSHACCFDVWDPDRQVHAIEAIRRWHGCPLGMLQKL